jgi:hypothetical protein
MPLVVGVNCTIAASADRLVSHSRSCLADRDVIGGGRRREKSGVLLEKHGRGRSDTNGEMAVVGCRGVDCR